MGRPPEDMSVGREADGAIGRDWLAHLGVTLTIVRVIHGESQAEVAARAGIRPNQVSRYETGQVLPQLPQLARLLDALGVTEVDFLLFHAQVGELIARLRWVTKAGTAGHSEVVALVHQLEARQVRLSRQLRAVLPELAKALTEQPAQVPAKPSSFNPA